MWLAWPVVGFEPLIGEEVDTLLEADLKQMMCAAERVADRGFGAPRS